MEGVHSGRWVIKLHVILLSQLHLLVFGNQPVKSDLVLFADVFLALLLIFQGQVAHWLSLEIDYGHPPQVLGLRHFLRRDHD